MSKRLVGVVTYQDEVTVRDGMVLRIADHPDASEAIHIGALVSFDRVETCAINLRLELTVDERCRTEICPYKGISYGGFCDHCEIDRALAAEDIWNIDVRPVSRSGTKKR